MHTPTGRPFIFAAVLLLVSAHALATEKQVCDTTYRALSDSIGPFLIAGTLAIAADRQGGMRAAVQTTKALITTTLVTQALKLGVPTRRPNGDGMDSFPSGHTSAAFAMATCIDAYQPKAGGLAYGSAAAIGYSRIEVGAHRWDEVVAGALIGYFIARHFTHDQGDSHIPSVGISISF